MWTSNNQVSATSLFDIVLRASGSVTETIVNSVTAGNQSQPAIAALADNRFVVVWTSAGQDGNGNGVFGRIFQPDGSPGTADFQVNTFTQGNQDNPAVAALPDGGFVVAWTSAGQDGSVDGVYAQAYNANGTRDGAEFRVNTFTTGAQNFPDIVPLAGNALGFVWQSNDQAGAASGFDIYMAVFGDPPPVWRFYNNANGIHFFTVSTAERDTVMATLPSFRFEGAGFAGAPFNFADTATVWRFFNNANGAHFYTIWESERNNVINTLPTFQFEGGNYVGYTSQATGTIPLYRFFNSVTGAHFFTTSEAERANVIATLPTFRFEGVAYYVDPVNG